MGVTTVGCWGKGSSVKWVSDVKNGLSHFWTCLVTRLYITGMGEDRRCLANLIDWVNASIKITWPNVLSPLFCWTSMEELQEIRKLYMNWE